MSWGEGGSGRWWAGGVVSEWGDGPEPDPRELEPWFLILHPKVQALIRERWAEQQREWQQVLRKGRLDYLWSAGQGALHFLLVHALLLATFWVMGVSAVAVQLLAVVAVGGALGLLWEYVHARELICLFSTVGVLFLLETVFVSARWIGWPALVGAPWLGGYLAQFIGAVRAAPPGS